MTQPSRICPTPRCPRLQPCDLHPRGPFVNAKRTGGNLYQTSRWRIESREHLAANPNCVELGCTTMPTVVDHIVAHRGDETLFWQKSNWDSMCFDHHQSKTARETRERVRLKNALD